MRLSVIFLILKKIKNVVSIFYSNNVYNILFAFGGGEAAAERIIIKQFYYILSFQRNEILQYYPISIPFSTVSSGVTKDNLPSGFVVNKNIP